MGMNRQLRAMKENFVPAGDADGGEVLDFEVTDFVGLVLDIDPAELGIGEFFPHREKPGPVLHARIAPFRAKATDHDHA